MVRQSTRNLTDYIKKNLKKGYTLESLRWALVNQGYSRVAIEDAIKQANTELAASAPILKEKPVINYEVMDENDKPLSHKKSWLRRLFGL